MSLFRRKSLSSLLAQAADSEKSLKRTLGPWNLIALGIGAIIGAGLFVRTAAAAGGHAGAADGGAQAARCGRIETRRNLAVSSGVMSSASASSPAR